MIKSELTQKIATANPQLLRQDAEYAVNIILEEITGALSRGDRVELRGFGAFTAKYRAPRKARNPKTGKPVFVGEKYAPSFKTGKDLRERLNSNSTAKRRKKETARRSQPARG